MVNGEPIRCRVAACRERGLDLKSWSFYLINDCSAQLDWTVLDLVDYEWGDMGSAKKVGARFASLAPGAHVLIWRDDSGAAEVRTTLSLRVCVQGREVPLTFEFPKLYRIEKMELVEGLGKPGWQVVSETRPAASASPGQPHRQA